MRSIVPTGVVIVAGILYSGVLMANGQPHTQQAGHGAAYATPVSASRGQIPGENLDALYEIPANRKSGRGEGKIRTLKAEDGITYKLVP
jgi:hypothetical protein